MPPALGTPSESAVRGGRSAEHLRAYRFTSDRNPAKTNPKAHRQPGSRNAQTIYLESLPVKARQWARSTAPAVLVDARKVALPIDSDAAAPTLTLDRCLVIAELQRRGIALPASGSDAGA